jgi:hypothetical protein
MGSERHQSRKIRAFLEKKKQEEEERIKDELNRLENISLDDKTIDMSIELIYNFTINKCNEYLEKNETISVIKILRKMISDGYDIDYIIVHLLSHGNTLFYQFIKQIRIEILNHFESYEEIVHSKSADEVIELLKFDILDLSYAWKVNKMDSLKDTIYMFMQLTDYNDKIQNYLFNRYNDDITHYGVMQHQLLFNVPHEIAIYLKSLKGNYEVDESVVNFKKILESYRKMEVNFQGSPMLKGRLVNLIRMIVNSVVYKGFTLPSRTEFYENFAKIYILKGNEKPLFLDILEWDTYWYIDCAIMQERANILFPYDGEDGRWV